VSCVSGLLLVNLSIPNCCQHYKFRRGLHVGINLVWHIISGTSILFCRMYKRTNFYSHKLDGGCLALMFSCNKLFNTNCSHYVRCELFQTECLKSATFTIFPSIIILMAIKLRKKNKRFTQITHFKYFLSILSLFHYWSHTWWTWSSLVEIRETVLKLRVEFCTYAFP
jgi:hypothetical protein